MNWGNRLLLLFLGFAALIATLVYKSVNTKFELVSKDYYKEELRYQDRIDGAANAAKAGNIRWQINGDSLRIRLPGAISDSAVKGTIWLYCVADASKDRRFPVDGALGDQWFDISQLDGKRYELNLQFQSGNTPYYYKESISLR